MKLQVAHEAYDYVSLKLQDSYVTNVRLIKCVITQQSVRNLRNNESFWLNFESSSLSKLSIELWKLLISHHL